MPQHDDVTVTVNGEVRTGGAPDRMLLTDFLRHELGLTGTHVGCEQGSCGACTILLDGQPVRACLLLAHQVDGHDVITVEGIADGDERHPVQIAMQSEHGLQCGFCTPGVIVSMVALLRDDPEADDEALRVGLSGNLCRCTGYHGILNAARRARELLQEESA